MPRHRKFIGFSILCQNTQWPCHRNQEFRPEFTAAWYASSIFLAFWLKFSFLEFSTVLRTSIQTVCFNFLTEKAASYRASSSMDLRGSKKNKERFLDDADLVRRSERKRRKVYETLNVKMLTDHRYLTGFENSKSPKKKSERKRYLAEEESDSQTEGDEVKFK